MYVMGDNSIFNQASQAKIQTELGKVEEIANIIYMNKIIEKTKNNLNEEVTLEEVIEQLKQERYQFESINRNGIIDITLGKEVLKMASNSAKIIEVLFSMGENTEHYLILNTKYYKINLIDNIFSINREPTNIQADITNIQLDAKSSKGIVTIGNISDNSIEINSGDIQGEDIVTIAYGNIVKECKVVVSNNVGALSEKDFEGKYFLYPAGNGKKILCRGLYAASDDALAEVVSDVSLR